MSRLPRQISNSVWMRQELAIFKKCYNQLKKHMCIAKYASVRYHQTTVIGYLVIEVNLLMKLYFNASCSWKKSKEKNLKKCCWDCLVIILKMKLCTSTRQWSKVIIISLAIQSVCVYFSIGLVRLLIDFVTGLACPIRDFFYKSSCKEKRQICLKGKQWVTLSFYGLSCVHKSFKNCAYK